MRPIVLIPGIGGSILVNKHKPTRNIMGKELVHNRWLNIYPFIPRNVDQWKNDMGCDVIRGSNGDVIGIKPVNDAIDVHDVGGTKGIKDVLPEFLLLPRRGQDVLQDMFQFRYFHDVCQVLYDRGYEDHASLFGIPYDFRLVLDPAFRSDLFLRMKETVEKAVATNYGKRCVVYSHSLGSIMFKWFLSSFVTEQWIADHISDIMLISPPFAGSVASLKTVIYGDFYLPRFHKLYMNELQHNTGIIMCLPNKIGFADDAELLRNGDHSITMNDYRRMDHVSMKIWRELYEPYLYDIVIKPLHGVRTTVFKCNTIPTPIWYGSKKKDEYPSDQLCADGDGIITSLCESVYVRMFGDRVDVRHVDSKHTHIIYHPEVVGKLLEYALTSDK